MSAAVKTSLKCPQMPLCSMASPLTQMNTNIITTTIAITITSIINSNNTNNNILLHSKITITTTLSHINISITLLRRHHCARCIILSLKKFRRILCSSSLYRIIYSLIRSQLACLTITTRLVNLYNPNTTVRF